MTREEAIKGLKVLAKDFSGYRPNEEMFNMAIEALEQSEIIPCRDCKWCEEKYDSLDKTPYWMCRNWDGETDADGFCYEAERGTDE